MKLLTSSPSLAHQRGIALVMVLVVVLAMGIMAAHFSFSMKIETQLALNTTRDPDMEWMGRSGVELAKYVLAEKTRIPVENQFDALSQFWAGGVYGTNEVLAAISLENVPLGDGTISVQIEDAERKFNINALGPEILNQSLMYIGSITSDLRSFWIP